MQRQIFGGLRGILGALPVMLLIVGPIAAKNPAISSSRQAARSESPDAASHWQIQEVCIDGKWLTRQQVARSPVRTSGWSSTASCGSEAR